MNVCLTDSQQLRLLLEKNQVYNSQSQEENQVYNKQQNQVYNSRQVDRNSR